MTRSDVLGKIASSWQAVAAIGAILALTASLYARGKTLIAIPTKLDSLTIIVRQHIDSSAKYGRIQAGLEHRTLCVLVATNQHEKEHCVLDNLGDP